MVKSWWSEWLGRGRVALSALVGGGLPPARAVEERGQWDFLVAGGGPADRPWPELREDLNDTLEAWRQNFLIRQVVRLTTAYVVGDGVAVSSDVPQVDEFVRAFWQHPENRLGQRLADWCDELTRAGELFPVLFTNRVSGMSQVRLVPAVCIKEVETAPDDYEKETGYLELVRGQVEPKRWKSKRTARVYRSRKPEPLMLHYAVSRPVGATRGEGDLAPLLPWARRYVQWLKDRVLLNRLRNQLAGVVVELDDDSRVEQKRQQYRANPPTAGSVTVVGRGERITFPAARLEGHDAEADGRALRLALAAGANVPLHFLAEGSSATRSTAAEMGDPTHRHYRMRQRDFAGFLVDLCEQAWRRYEQVQGLEPLGRTGLVARMPDVSRADNEALARSAHTLVQALAVMKE